MAAQPVDLIAQRLFRDFEIGRLPARPAFPEVAAAPSRHHQNSLAVGELVEILSLKLAFEPDGVQADVFYVPDLIPQALRTFAQHHLLRPSVAATQDVHAVVA